MKLPYTPLQTRLATRRRTWPRSRSRSTASRWSAAPAQPGRAGLRRNRSRRARRVPAAAGGALPISLSDAVRALRRAGLLEVDRGSRACLDGDAACVSWLLPSPGRPPEGSRPRSARSGPASSAPHLPRTRRSRSPQRRQRRQRSGGRPVIAPRVSQVDSRDRHRVVSHHTLAVLELSLGRPAVAWPAGSRPRRRSRRSSESTSRRLARSLRRVPLRSMGRGPEDDPWFFAAAFAAGRLGGAGSGEAGRRSPRVRGEYLGVTVEHWDGREREIVERPESVASWRSTATAA